MSSVLLARIHIQTGKGRGETLRGTEGSREFSFRFEIKVLRSIRSMK